MSRTVTRRSRIPFVVLGLSLFGAFGPPAQAQEEQSPNLRPGDIVEIRVWPDPEGNYGGEFLVEQSGIIYVPAAGAVPVTGRTVTEIREMLLERLAETLRRPVVQVVPRFRVSLLGAVRGAGLHYIDPTVTLVELISQGGGLAPDAKPQDIRIVRGDSVYTANLKPILEEGEPGIDVPLQSGDRILVPAGGGFNWGNFVRTTLQTLTLVFTIANFVN